MSRILTHWEIIPRRPDSLAGGPGFEPRLTESESAVLPLNYPPHDGRRSSHSFADGKRAAAETWARFVEQLVTGEAVDNVSFDESGAFIFRDLAGAGGTMKSDIAALDLTTGSPIFGEPVLRQNYLLPALPLVVGGSPEVPRRRRKSAPDRERALLAINALWPNGVPDKIILHNSTLCKEVSAWLKKRGLPDVKDDTILRASKRRK